MGIWLLEELLFLLIPLSSLPLLLLQMSAIKKRRRGEKNPPSPNVMIMLTGGLFLLHI